MTLSAVEVATDRELVHGAVVEVTERAAALRWRLDRDPDRMSSDAVTTTETSAVDEGRPVEVKAARRWVRNGDGRARGRFALTRSTHRDLSRDGGYYALLVYRLVDVGGDESLLLDGADLVPAVALTAEVDRLGSSPARVRWDRVVAERRVEQ